VISPARGKYRGALGVPAPGQDLAVVDPDTRDECPRAAFDEHGRLLNAADAIGEIVRRDGGFRFEGYFDNEDATASRVHDGWYWSGDLAYRDDEGVFYFAGRSSDWIRVDAENFAAAPVERILVRHPDVAAVAVYGVPDAVTGDQVMAAVELRAGRAFEPAAFDAFLAEQSDLGTKWSPRYVRIVDRMPVTGADKIDKKPLRAAAWCTTDDVWWRPEPKSEYRLMSDEDVSALEQEFARHGRAGFWPSA
jgi:fatty-acyl-CoA synthase